MLERAPRQPWLEPSLEALREDGVVLIPNVLSSAKAATLYTHLESKLAQSLAAITAGRASEKECFAPIACRRGRHMVNLTLEPVIVDALAEALPVLRPYLQGAFESEEPVLAELAGIRSSNGAPSQPVHSDINTPCPGPPGVLSVFVALQDVDEEMGPTIFLPGTHADKRAHAAIKSPSKKAQLLRNGPIRLGTMPAGACTLYDGHLLHAGGANESPRCRWLLNVTFVPPLERFSIALLDVYEEACRLGVHTLGQLERGSVRGQDDEETRRLVGQWRPLFEDKELRRLKGLWDMTAFWTR